MKKLIAQGRYVVEIPPDATISEKYMTAMVITHQEEADAYLAALVADNFAHGTKTREQAELIERSNIAYFAGYQNHETRLRVERLFRCEHPIFGPATDGAVEPEDALQTGILMGLAARDKRL